MKLKKLKQRGVDDIPNEIRKYKGKELAKKLTELFD